MGKQVSEAGARDLGFLIEEVSFGDEHQRVFVRQMSYRLLGAVQESNRRVYHFLGKVDELLDLVALDAAFGQLDGCLDHGKREALDAVTKVVEVVDLRFVQPFLDPFGRVIGGEELGEPGLRVDEEWLVVPQSVVGVESDEVDHRGGRGQGAGGRFQVSGLRGQVSTFRHLGTWSALT